MICPKCSTQNIDGSKFCIRCGSVLSDSQINQTFNTQNTQSNISQSTQVSYSDQINNSYLEQTNNKSITKISIRECFYIILAVILKPFTAFKQELNKFNDFKSSAILSLAVSIIATLISLVKTMISSVRVTSYWSSEVEWVWENLKEINYIKVIGTNFFIYLGIIALIAGIYYIGSLIIKKQTNFARLLGISAMAVSPMLICSLILSPLLSLVWVELAMPITLIGAVYTLVILYEGINSEILLDGNAKYYFNLVCFSILGIVMYYLCIELFMSSISGGFEDIMDLFG